MLTGDPILLPPEASAEAKTYLRIEGGGEDALVARLMTSAAELCERFAGQALLARAFSETLPASATWTRLGTSPVRTISAVEALVGSAASVLPTDAYAIDIDAAGDGWVRVTQPGAATRIRVSYEAGLAPDWAALPEALRQGMVRLATHLFTHREAADGPSEPPAAVTALWRPWRRMRLR